MIQHICSESAAAAEWRVAMCEEQISPLLLSERRIVTSCLPRVKMEIVVNGSRRLLSSAEIIERAGSSRSPTSSSECRHGFSGAGRGGKKISHEPLVVLTQRRKVGGFKGPPQCDGGEPRVSGLRCGRKMCVRTKERIEPGTEVPLGCHKVHCR